MKNMTNTKVDTFLNKEQRWKSEITKLRAVILDLELAEDFKWGVPCYTLNGNNVLLIHGFKNYCAILFFKGALLSDSENLLIRQTENVQASRQLRFNSVDEIKAMETSIKTYINEAIKIEQSGLKVELKIEANNNIPEELEFEFDKNPTLKTAFKALTPGRQRAYILHFSAAKQSKTRVSRIEKNIPRIFDGLGLDD